MTDHDRHSLYDTPLHVYTLEEGEGEGKREGEREVHKVPSYKIQHVLLIEK